MSKSKVLAGILGGIAVGVAIGLMVSPASGEENIRRAKRKGRKYYDQLQDDIKESKESWYEAKGKLEDSASLAKDEVDELLEYIIAKGKNWWNRTKSAADDVMDDVQRSADKTADMAKETIKKVVDETSNSIDDAKSRMS